MFSPDGELLAASSLHSGMICLWSTQSWRLLRKIDCKTLFADALRYLSPLANAAEEMMCLYHSISFHPNKNLLAASFPSTLWSSKIQIRDLSDGSLRTSFGSVGSSVAFSPSGKVIAAEGRLWDSEALTEVCNLEGAWIEFDRSERLLAALCSDIGQDGRLYGSIRVWRLPGGRTSQGISVREPKLPPKSCCFFQRLPLSCSGCGTEPN